MPVSDWLPLMPDTVVYKSIAGATRDGAGKPTYGAGTNYRARVVYKEIRTSNRVTGQDAVGAGVVWFGAIISDIAIDDQITLPDGSNPNILNWATYSDQFGPHHTRVIFGGTQAGGQRASS